MHSYRFTLVYNESEVMHEEWGTENFRVPPLFLKEVEFDARDEWEAVRQMKDYCQSFSNQDWDWEYSEVSQSGEFSFGNDCDGLALRFEFYRMDDDE